MSRSWSKMACPRRSSPTRLVAGPCWSLLCREVRRAKPTGREIWAGVEVQDEIGVGGRWEAGPQVPRIKPSCPERGRPHRLHESLLEQTHARPLPAARREPLRGEPLGQHGGGVATRLLTAADQDAGGTAGGAWLSGDLAKRVAGPAYHPNLLACTRRDVGVRDGARHPAAAHLLDETLSQGGLARAGEAGQLDDGDGHAVSPPGRSPRRTPRAGPASGALPGQSPPPLPGVRRW